MMEKTTKIELPPPRMIRPGGRERRFPRWLWVVIVALSLVIGVGSGMYLERACTTVESGGTSSAEGSSGLRNQEQIEVKQQLAKARAAVAEGDWLRAREIFQAVRKVDPENEDALASLPLIDKHLAAAVGTLIVKTKPAGASVKVKGFGTRSSPAEFSHVPLGRHKLEISLNGFDSVTRDVDVRSEGTTRLPVVSLSRSTGKLEVVSEPRGVDFKVIKSDAKNKLKELIEVGKTPAMIEKLDPGEYRVLMEAEGWPEYSELIRVQQNRNASVSAVFARGGLNITSDPVGAEVWVRTGKKGPLNQSGATPITLPDLPVGKQQVELRYRDWPPIRRTVDVQDGVTQNLEFSWEPGLVNFRSDPVGAEVYLSSKRLGDGRQVTPFSIELPAGEYLFTAKYRKLAPVNKTITVNAETESNGVGFSFEYGTVKIESEPGGAAVVSNGVPLGRTPLVLPVVPPGNYSYRLSKEQYVSSTVSGQLQPGGSLNLSSSLKYDPVSSTDNHIKNGVGQSLIWFGSLNGWVGTREVTQEVYQKVMGGPKQNPSAFKAPNHPVDSVNWYQANQFAEKLTILERSLGNLPAGYHYRLPTDEEWSEYVGKQDLSQAVTSVYERLESTRPVGSMQPNEYGLFDVRGNVWEWCSDWYSQTIVNRIQKEGASANNQWIGTERKVMRGGAWNRSSQYDLSIANRRAARPSTSANDIGFRVVLMRD